MKPISRQGLWWAEIPWQDVRQHLLAAQKLEWSQHNWHRQVKLGLPLHQDVKNIIMGGLQLRTAAQLSEGMQQSVGRNPLSQTSDDRQLLACVRGGGHPVHRLSSDK